MPYAVEREGAKAAVKAGDGQDRITVVKDPRGAVVKGNVQLVTHAERLRLYADVGQARGIKTNGRTVVAGTFDLTVHKHALGKFTVGTVKARATEQPRNIKRWLLLGLFVQPRLGAQIGDQLVYGKQRNTVQLLGQVETAIGFGKDDRAVDRAVNAVKVLHTAQKLIGGPHGTFLELTRTVFLDLIKFVAVRADLTLPIFDLQNEGYAPYRDEKILFKVERLVGNDHVADHAIEMLAKQTVNGFLAVGTKLLDLIGNGYFLCGRTVDDGFQNVAHEFLFHINTIKKIITQNVCRVNKFFGFLKTV